LLAEHLDEQHSLSLGHIIEASHAIQPPHEMSCCNVAPPGERETYGGNEREREGEKEGARMREETSGSGEDRKGRFYRHCSQTRTTQRKKSHSREPSGVCITEKFDQKN